MINKVIQRNIHISHRKAQLVCDLIRNKKVSEAIVILKNTNKKMAPIVLKLLNSAIANATNNHAMNAEKLYVYNIYANQGPTWKRTMPRARGSADMMFKRTTHLEIHLSDNPNERKEQILATKLKKQKSKIKSKKPVQKETKKPEPKSKPETSKVEAKAKPKKINGIEVGKKHITVKKADVAEYNYEKRLKQWKTNAGYNEEPIKCSICKDDHKFTSILTEDNKHICYLCWIKKEEFKKQQEKLAKGK